MSSTYGARAPKLAVALSIAAACAMAWQRTLVRVLVLWLLCCACAAAKRRYISISMDELLGSSKAHIDCPPWKKSVISSGNKLTIPAVCGLPTPPPKCCGGGGSFERHVLNHDMNRLNTLLQRSSSVSQAAAAPAPSADPIPWFPFPPAPSPHPRAIPISFPPVSPRAPAEAPAATIPDSSGKSLGTFEFVVTVGFGTPAKPYTLIVDTGSDVSWIQCQPCSGHCYEQHDPIFDPTMSATYSALPCGHPLCAAAGGKCGNGTCLYKVEYGDRSSTAGVLSHETLSLTSTQALRGFAFGCGQNNHGFFGEVDGLLGLGRGALSLPSQAAAASFSYCLPSDNKTHGFLTIGSATPAAPNGVQYTAMVQKKEHPSLYFVELVAIDVGGDVLPVPPAVFTRGGTLIDSGTILTYLPAEAYAALRDRFKLAMARFNYEPAPATAPFDTCYDFRGHGSIFLPGVSFKFNDSSVFGISPFGILVFPDDTAPATGCLAFVGQHSATTSFTVIGNMQQRNTEVIYDVAAEKIGFALGGC